MDGMVAGMIQGQNHGAVNGGVGTSPPPPESVPPDFYCSTGNVQMTVVVAEA